MKASKPKKLTFAEAWDSTLSFFNDPALEQEIDEKVSALMTGSRPG